ncbi:unnamed protein product [Notodromas monacha]|uniref:Uncharacterized protein n=1 Tax=Notodromas monacha TaxID=399045 RepID=A0A7R9BDT4_9CRUS|nr:unnamed protein product [Notodromas monacha]CAG0912317.1 unnamed protein product [Notodromas monacha]
MTVAARDEGFSYRELNSTAPQDVAVASANHDFCAVVHVLVGAPHQGNAALPPRQGEPDVCVDFLFVMPRPYQKCPTSPVTSGDRDSHTPFMHQSGAPLFEVSGLPAPPAADNPFSRLMTSLLDFSLKSHFRRLAEFSLGKKPRKSSSLRVQQVSANLFSFIQHFESLTTTARLARYILRNFLNRLQYRNN